jgi:hypothetical protein
MDFLFSHRDNGRRAIRHVSGISLTTMIFNPSAGLYLNVMLGSINLLNEKTKAGQA